MKSLEMKNQWMNLNLNPVCHHLHQYNNLNYQTRHLMFLCPDIDIPPSFLLLVLRKTEMKKTLHRQNKQLQREEEGIR